MSFGEHALSKHAQSINDLNLKKHLYNYDLLRKRVYTNKKIQLDLNHFEHVCGGLVFKCPVDNTLAFLGQRERDSVNIAQA